MFELGSAADDEHYQLGQGLAALEIDAVLTVGDHMVHTARALNEIRDIAVHFDDKQALLAALKAHLNNGVSTVLFKGSRGMKMESLIGDLMNA